MFVAQGPTREWTGLMIQDTIKLIGAGLDDGDTHRGECPECGNRKTFTVTRDVDALVWNCYSANCGLTPGRLGGRRHSVVPDLPHGKLVKENNPYEGRLEALDEQHKEDLWNRIGFDEEHLRVSGVRWAPDERRYAFPIIGPLGVRRGWTLRSWTNPYPKSLTRMDESGVAHLSWYRRRRPGRVDAITTEHSEDAVRAGGTTGYVVEDIPSAVRLGRHRGLVIAMNGGGVGVNYLAEIAKYVRHIVWAFDQDATGAALRHKRKYSMLFESSAVLPLKHDFKDMTEDEICTYLTD